MNTPAYHFDIPQYELAWVKLHLGRPTASGLSRILDSKFELRTGDMVKTFIYEKCFEMFKGHALPGGFASYETDQGMLLEDEAREYYQLMTGNRIRRCGFVESADRRCGCSPDALVGDDGGLELKCPQPTNAVKYLIENRLPLDYAAQVQGSLYVTGRKWWDFFSYSRSRPAFLLRVERDEEVMQKIDDSLQKYYAKFDETFAKLKAHRP